MLSESMTHATIDMPRLQGGDLNVQPVSFTGQNLASDNLCGIGSLQRILNAHRICKIYRTRVSGIIKESEVGLPTCLLMNITSFKNIDLVNRA